MPQKTAISVKNEDTLKKFWWYRAVFVPLLAKLMFNKKHRTKKNPRAAILGNFIGCFVLQKFGDWKKDKEKYFHGCKVR